MRHKYFVVAIGGYMHRQETHFGLKCTILDFQKLMGMCHPLIFIMVSTLLHRYMNREQPLCREYASQILCSSHRGVYTWAGASFSVTMDHFGLSEAYGHVSSPDFHYGIYLIT